MRSKYFFKNITVLNLLLASVIVFMAYYVLFPQMGAGMKYTLPSPKKTVIEKADSQESFNPQPSSSYTIIADNNLFNPDRKIPLEKKTADDQQPLPKPDVVLYGTLITDTFRLAYIEDLKAPRNTVGRGKRQTIVRVGDSLSGFVIREIDPDKIVMAKGDERITVRIHESRKLKTSEIAANKPSSPPVQQADPRLMRRDRRSAAESLVKPRRIPKTRAKTSGSEERALDFFRKPPP